MQRISHKMSQATRHQGVVEEGAENALRNESWDWFQRRRLRHYQGNQAAVPPPSEKQKALVSPCDSFANFSIINLDMGR
jgi:hypothetical protein